jgi:hypothetical protein
MDTEASADTKPSETLFNSRTLNHLFLVNVFADKSFTSKNGL